MDKPTIQMIRLVSTQAKAAYWSNASHCGADFNKGICQDCYSYTMCYATNMLDNLLKTWDKQVAT